jgi:hypothetical protein
LHKLGKEIFMREFLQRQRDGIPFHLKLCSKIKCQKYNEFDDCCSTIKHEYDQIDLTKAFPEIRMEKRNGEFIPDLLVINREENKYVFIEIVVSNPPSQEKLDSGNPIIQINACNEEDFDFLSIGVLSEETWNIELHNFVMEESTTSNCEGISCSMDSRRKQYFEVLKWIVKSFEDHKINSHPFYLEYPKKYSCSLYHEKLETSCKYSLPTEVDLMKHYKSVSIEKSIYSAHLRFHHYNDQSRDLIICKSEEFNKKEWSGGRIELIDSHLFYFKMNEYLQKISGTSGAFKISPIKKKIVERPCDGKCKKTYTFFCIRQDYGAVLLEMSLSDPILHNDTFRFIRMIEGEDLYESTEVTYFKMVESTFKESIPVKNCYICRYHALNNSDSSKDQGPIFCKTFKTACKSNEAVSCPRYNADLTSCEQNYIGRYAF